MKTNSVDSAGHEEQISQLSSIATYRKGVLSKLEKALKSKDFENAIKYASMIVGLPITENMIQDKGNDKSAGISQGVNPRSKQ